MKWILIFLFFPVFSFAQTSTPAKGNNRIAVKGVSFNQVKEKLLHLGYSLAQQDAARGTLATSARNIDINKIFGPVMDRYQAIIYVNVKDSIAIFREEYSDYAQHGTMSRFTEVDYWKSTTSVPGHLFYIMEQIAITFGKKLIYSTVNTGKIDFRKIVK